MLGTYIIPGTVPGAGDTAIRQTHTHTHTHPHTHTVPGARDTAIRQTHWRHSNKADTLETQQ